MCQDSTCSPQPNRHARSAKRPSTINDQPSTRAQREKRARKAQAAQSSATQQVSFPGSPFSGSQAPFPRPSTITDQPSTRAQRAHQCRLSPPQVHRLLSLSSEPEKLGPHRRRHPEVRRADQPKTGDGIPHAVFLAWAWPAIFVAWKQPVPDHPGCAPRCARPSSLSLSTAD